MTELPQGPWQSIAIDFMGPLPSGDYVLAVTDDSNWPMFTAGAD